MTSTTKPPTSNDGKIGREVTLLPVPNDVKRNNRNYISGGAYSHRISRIDFELHEPEAGGES